MRHHSSSSINQIIVGVVLIGWVVFLISSQPSPGGPRVSSTDLSDTTSNQTRKDVIQANKPIILNTYQQQEQSILQQFVGTGQYS
jgi:hypothetical protein